MKSINENEKCNNKYNLRNTIFLYNIIYRNILVRHVIYLFQYQYMNAFLTFYI